MTLKLVLSMESWFYDPFSGVWCDLSTMAPRNASPESRDMLMERFHSNEKEKRPFGTNPVSSNNSQGAMGNIRDLQFTDFGSNRICGMIGEPSSGMTSMSIFPHFQGHIEEYS